jgi:sterol desaturase/sphingolipid hydroxylase (fatty acid hydroxylase superfamily)
MNDAQFGSRDKRGDWKPFYRIEYPPLFMWPVRPVQFLKWFFGYPGYLLPWNIIYALFSTMIWLYLTPSMATTQTFSVGWLSYLLLRNAAFVLIIFGGWHFFLYIRKSQSNSFKFDGKWPSTNNDAFLFRRQNIDNIIWTFACGVPVWTAYEAGILWAFANGYVPYISWTQHPVYCLAILLLIPAFHDVHFYLVHRLIHWPPLYRRIHSLHHNNVNPGPWSGLAMHPIEHVLYFSGALIHLVVPSHPLHVLFHLQHSGLTPAQGHTGFDRVVIGRCAVSTSSYSHYLHHKFFECNYSDGPVPLDKWLGTHHDGSKQSQDAMDRRFAEKSSR